MDQRSIELMDDPVLEAKGVSNSKPKCITNNKNMSMKPEAAKPRTNRSLKVQMQTLQLTQESEKQLYDTLKYIYGSNFKLADASEYEDKNSNLGKQYWLQRGSLIIKGITNYSALNRTAKTDEQLTREFATSKLESYSFHATHCTEALAHCDGNVGKALEILFSKYYEVGGIEENNFNNIDINECMERRMEEKEALESIYGENFKEKIRNQIWTVDLSLDYLIESEETKKLEQSKPLLKDICRLYLRGKCRFGIKCRFIHQQPDTLQKPKPKIDTRVTLEIRFAENCTYPYQAPYFYFHKNNAKLADIQFLRLGRMLHNEALKFSVDGIPSIFSIISLLENESEVKNYLEESKEQFLDKNDPLFKKELRSEDVAPLFNKKGSLNRKNRINISVEEIMEKNGEIKKNFIEKQKNSSYIKLKEHRKTLPAWNLMEEILSTIDKNQVTIISGETGCGKSTQVPQFIFDDWIINFPKENEHIEIICTQPRRISAIGVAQRVATERDEKCGHTVGYSIRLESKISSYTRLTFCTTGILLQRLCSDPLLNSVTHVIVDEVHERSAESDFLLMLLRRILPKRPNLKLILMSATLKADEFSSYFENVPVLDIPGRTFPVSQIFLEDILELLQFVMEENSKYTRKFKGTWEQLNTELVTAEMQSSMPEPKNTILDDNLTLPQVMRRYIDYSKLTQKNLYIMDHEKINYDLIERIIEWIVEGEHEYPKTGSILVFLPGIAEIITLKDVLKANKIFSQNTGRFLILPLHSSLSGEEQSLVFQKTRPDVRKIVLSTNIAETSITIDDCVYVIDSGKMKETRFNSSQNMESLETCWVSRANALQRMGRAGRVMPGVCIQLYSSFRFDHHFISQPIPEILRISLESVILRIKVLEKNRKIDIYDILGSMIDPPGKENIKSAMVRLEDVGALDPEGMLTPLGHHLAALPVDVRIGKLILFGAIFCCLDSALTIAACLSHKSPFLNPIDKKNEVNNKKKEYAIANSDHLTTLRVYKKWLEVNALGYLAGQTFANENFLSIKTLRVLADIKHQFLELLVSIGFVPINIGRSKLGVDRVLEMTSYDLNVNNDNYKLLQGLLCGALYPNVVKVYTPEKSFQMQNSGAIPRQPNAEELKFQTKHDGLVNIHPSSINFSTGYFYSPYLVFQEKIKTSRIYIREISMVSMLSLILFSGYGINVELHNGMFVLSLEDGWIMFAVESHRVGQLLQLARIELVKLLEQKMEDPLLNLVNHPQGKKLIATIVDVITNQ